MDGKPMIAFSVQGGDTQEQNLLQFFLNMVEFDMNVQQAVVRLRPARPGRPGSGGEGLRSCPRI